MFSSSELSIRKPSRFGGDNDDIRPATPPDSHYRVPLHPSADFQVNRGALSDYDFYLVPTHQNRNSTQTPRVTSHSDTLSDINYGNSKYTPSDGSISSANYNTPSVRFPTTDRDKKSQRRRQPHSCNVEAARHDRSSTHDFYNSLIDESDAHRDLASSDYSSDGTSATGPEDQHIDDCSSLSDDDLSVEPFLTGSEPDHDSADDPSGNNRLASRTRRLRLAGRLPMTSKRGEDNLEASRHCQPAVETNLNKHIVSLSSADEPQDGRRVKREPGNVFLASVQAAVGQPVPPRPATLKSSSISSSANSSATSGGDSSAQRFTAHRDDHNKMNATSFDPDLWKTWNINTWKATPSSQGYTLSMPRPYLPLQFTASELRRVVEKQQKSLPRISSSVPRTNSSVNDISSWDEFHAEYQELCKNLNLSLTAQNKATSSRS